MKIRDWRSIENDYRKLKTSKLFWSRLHRLRLQRHGTNTPGSVLNDQDDIMTNIDDILETNWCAKENFQERSCTNSLPGTANADEPAPWIWGMAIIVGTGGNSTYVEENNILSEEQAGFRKDRSTIDHILTLDTLIATRLNMKQETFIAFLVGGLRQYVGFLKGQYSHQSSSTYSLMTRGKFNIRKSNIVTLPRKPGKDRKNQDGIRWWNGFRNQLKKGKEKYWR